MPKKCTENTFEILNWLNDKNSFFQGGNKVDNRVFKCYLAQNVKSFPLINISCISLRWNVFMEEILRKFCSFHKLCLL